MLHDIKQAAIDAGMHIRNELGSITTSRKADNSVVTNVDKSTQDFLQKRILSLYPDHGILGEEELSHNVDSEYLWIVDPIDGTQNFTRGIPSYNVSIAVAHKGKVMYGVVHDPIHNETFSAERGKGSTLNGSPIAVTTASTPEGALLALGTPRTSEMFKGGDKPFLEYQRLFDHTRVLGDMALELCYVACGRFDALVKRRQKPWDFAAGALILEEAGGKATNTKGEPLGIEESSVVATNGKLHDLTLEYITRT